MSEKSYLQAGVDIDAGNELVARIRPAVTQTHTEHVLDGLGGFASLFRMPEGYKEPVLVSCTDGVGSKLKLAQEHGALNVIGTDLVAMCVNDLLTTGARPLFFLDYYASAKLDLEQATEIINGIARACRLAGCALVGGESAEVPGLYRANDFDLAGFCVGVAERKQLMGRARVRDGDALIALGSSGLHANGFSLARAILDEIGSTSDFVTHGPIKNKARSIELLLKPTLLYNEALDKVRGESLHAVAHITGGGLAENLSRVLPQGAIAEITHPVESWPALFRWIQQQGPVEEPEMRRVFNCGIGMVLCVATGAADTVMGKLSRNNGEVSARRLGTIRLGPEDRAPRVVVRD